MKKLNKILAAIIVLAVIAFVTMAFPSVLHNIVQDIITKR